MTTPAPPPGTAPPRGTGSLEPRPPSASQITLSRIMTLLDSNLHGNVHGGVIMKVCDDAAGVVAARHTGGRAVTAAMDEMVFLTPVHVGDLVTARARVNWAGKTSVEIGVRVTAEPWDQAGAESRHVATAYVVLVAIDEAGRPRPCPPVQPDTPTDRRRFAEAQIRRGHRLARRDAILSSRAGPSRPGAPD